MACFHPLSGYRVSGGQIKFCPPGQWWRDTIKVGCGQCIGCKAERARQWGVRGMHELQMTTDNHPTTPTSKGSFITLTFDEEHLPENGQLEKKIWQNFAKKLRRDVGPFRFLMCGEYGSRSKTERCHFHAAVFGQDFVFPKDANRQLHKKNDQGHPLFTSPVLDRVWGKGQALIGDITFDSVNYVAGYINKKVNGKMAKQHYSRVNEETGECYNLEPEFALMSRNPGLGNTWIEKYWPEVYPADEVLVNGQVCQPPAYYDRWLADNHPELMEEVKQKRKIKGKVWEDDNTPARLAVKKKVFTSKKAQYKRG